MKLHCMAAMLQPGLDAHAATISVVQAAQTLKTASEGSQDGSNGFDFCQTLGQRATARVARLAQSSCPNYCVGCLLSTSVEIYIRACCISIQQNGAARP